MDSFRNFADRISNKYLSDIDDVSGVERIKPSGGSSGTTRAAYRIKRNGKYKGKVLKIAVTRSAKTEMQSEIKTWMKVKGKSDADLFCPIRDFDRESNDWIVMDYAQPVEDMNIALSRLASEFQLYRIDKSRVEEYYDINYDNIGFHSDLGLVIFDYPWAEHYDKIRSESEE